MMFNFGAVFQMMENSSEEMMEMPEFKEILNEKFDLMVIGFFMNEMLLGYSHHFQCPSMMVSANAAMTHINKIFGNPLELNAVPHLMMDFKGNLNFLNRVMNFLAVFMDLGMSAFFNYRQKLFYE